MQTTRPDSVSTASSAIPASSAASGRAAPQRDSRAFLPRTLGPAFLRTLIAALIAASALTSPAARAHGGGDASTASALSLSLPVAVVASAPVAILASGTVLTVVAVQASAAGTVWVLERASDGARVVLRLSGSAARGASAVVGATVLVTAISAGMLLSAAGELLCFVPNQVGASLLHNERIDR